MAGSKKKLDPAQLDYWFSEAHKLKHAADLCWQADEDIVQSAEKAQLFGIDHTLIKAAYDAESELSWLYPNLIAFAIQHLAIGILIKRNPKLFIQDASHFQIVKVVQDCGVKIKSEVAEILYDVENAFKWSEMSPRWSVNLSSEQIRTLQHNTSHYAKITSQKKQQLDELFDELDVMAKKELAQ